jgi:hypothetical protein
VQIPLPVAADIATHRLLGDKLVELGLQILGGVEFAFGSYSPDRPVDDGRLVSDPAAVVDLSG